MPENIDDKINSINNSINEIKISNEEIKNTPSLKNKRGRPPKIKKDNIQIIEDLVNKDLVIDVKNDNKMTDSNILNIKNKSLIKIDENNNKNIINNDLNSNIFLKDLLNKQLPNIASSKKLNYNDIKRISKFLTTSIFDQKECSIWNGYITNEKNQSKGTYINFYFNQKKIALHRLLYLNFIGDILNTEYIKFICTNKGKCCNINHMKKYSYNSIENTEEINNIKNNNINNNILINIDKNKLTIEL